MSLESLNRQRLRTPTRTSYMPSLHTLPDNIISYVLVKLPVKDIASCLRTCSAIHAVGIGEYLWKALAQRDLSSELLSLKLDSENWHDFCKLHLGYTWKKLEPKLQYVVKASSAAATHVPDLRIVVGGKHGVGKTALICRFSYNQFIDSASYDESGSERKPLSQGLEREFSVLILQCSNVY